MYYIVFLLLLFFSVVEIYKGRKNPTWFIIIYLMMTCMVMFRYGQMSDYFNYKLAYEDPEKVTFVDPLYFVIKAFFQNLGVGYKGYVMIEGFLTMFLAYPFFSKLCQKSIVGLLVFYCYAFLIYPMNAVRQGLCISVLLFCFYHLLKGRKIIFLILVILFCFVHLSILSTIIILFIYKKKWFNNNIMWWVVLFMTVFAIITPDITSLIPPMFIERIYEADGEGKMLPMLIRFAIIVPILLIKPQLDTIGYNAKAICVSGYIIYCLFSFSPLTAGRLETYYRVFLSLFVSYTIFSLKKTALRSRLLTLLILIHSVLFFKNMSAAIDQGDYNRDEVTFMSFPYISIFDEGEYDEYNHN